ncbi:MAG: S1 RNA-binding domain-containing protein, partial [Bdellovibrionales bacterium]|nr:S1 RNA-binding domain-containing protein [Bdellovibrionales bacterium]
VVDKKEVFGLFVRLASGYTGLLPKSKWRDSAEGQQYESKKRGDTIRVRVDEIKDDERKVSLGLPTEAQDESWREHSGTQKMGTMADLFAQMKITAPVAAKKK